MSPQSRRKRGNDLLKPTPRGPAQWGVVGVCLALMASLATSCGSRRDEDIDAVTKDTARASEPSKIAMSLPGANSDSVGSSDPCSLLLKQTPRFIVDKVKGESVEATFSGVTDKSCEDADKKPVLYIKVGSAQFTPPVELDCQPRAREGWNMRCINAAPVINAKGEISVVITGDVNYRSSQTSIMLTYEVP